MIVRNDLNLFTAHPSHIVRMTALRLRLTYRVCRRIARLSGIMGPVLLLLLGLAAAPAIGAPTTAMIPSLTLMVSACFCVESGFVRVSRQSIIDMRVALAHAAHVQHTRVGVGDT